MFECGVGWEKDGGPDDALAALIWCMKQAQDSPGSSTGHAGRGLVGGWSASGVSKACVVCGSGRDVRLAGRVAE